MDLVRVSKLVEYIQENRKKGYTDEELKSIILGKGYTKDEFHHAVESLKENK